MALSVNAVIGIVLSKIGGVPLLPALRSKIEGRMPTPQMFEFSMSFGAIKSAFSTVSALKDGGVASLLQSNITGALSSFGAPFASSTEALSAINTTIANPSSLLSNVVAGNTLSSLTNMTALGGQLDAIIADPLNPLFAIATSAKSVLSEAVTASNGIISHVDGLITDNLHPVIALSTAYKDFPEEISSIKNFSIKDFTSSIDISPVINETGSYASTISDLLTNGVGDITSQINEKLALIQTNTTKTTETMLSDINNFNSAQTQSIALSNVASVVYGKAIPDVADNFINKVIPQNNAGTFNILAATVSA